MRVARGANEASLRPDQDRIFWWGKIMRRLKIDELPQLMNILNGTMSIVGPRPAAVDQVDITRGGANAIAATVPCGLTSQSSLWDYIFGDQFSDEEESFLSPPPVQEHTQYSINNKKNQPLPVSSHINEQEFPPVGG